MAQQETEEAGNALFAYCSIAFVPSKTLTQDVIDKLSDTIIKYGGDIVDRRQDGTLPVPECTHIIAASVDFPEYTEATAYMIPVVTTAWVNASLHKNRQAQVRPYSPDPRMIFSRVVLTSADIPHQDKEAIAGAVIAMGGSESKDVARLTTHICALSMNHPKVETALEKKLKCKIVLPMWFEDCFKLGKVIDEGPYLLPNPEILSKQPEDDVAIPPSPHVNGATTTTPTRPPTTAEYQAGSREQLTVFKDKKVMLSWDLGLNARLQSTLSDLITGGGGEVVDEIDVCDWMICHYRDGPQYVRAAQQSKDIGNLSWLYHLIAHNEWTNPLRRLLHYPVPKNGIEGFKNLRITLSNYGGDARVYLENLIIATGATFTKTMKADNTHLITARDNSEKCEAARDWNVDMANHLWIEESYARCEVQSLTNSRYTHFPPRTNLGEIIGQTQFDEAKLREKYYPGGDEHLTHSAKRKRLVLEAAQEAELEHGPAAGVKREVLSDKGTENTPSRTKQNRASKVAKSDVMLNTPAGGRKSGKENNTPSLTSSGRRGAAMSALDKLKVHSADMVLYEKENKRSSKTGNAPWGGKRAANELEQQLESAKKTTPAHARPDADEADEADDADDAARPAKKARSSLPAVEMRVMLTGYRRWLSDKKKEEADRKKLRNLGIHLVQEGQPCDYLAAPALLRTIKFCRALASGPNVISSAFIDACIDTGKMADPADFPLVDKDGEKKFEIDLERSVQRSRKNKGRLLWGVAVYCTADIKNGFNSYRIIAEANGAIFKTYRARGQPTIKPTNPAEDAGGQEPVYLLTSNSKAEREVWPKFEAMAKAGNMKPRIVVSDWLLHVALDQKLTFDEKYRPDTWFAEKAKEKA